MHEVFKGVTQTRFNSPVRKMRKVTISFMSICPSARNNSAANIRIFMKFDIYLFL